MKIVVTIEGGLVTGVHTDEPTLLGVGYDVVDFDSDGADIADTKLITDDGTKIGRASIGGGAIEKLTMIWDE